MQVTKPKRPRVLALTLMVVACAALVSNAAAEEPYAGATFKRVTLVVADLDRSLRIYIATSWASISTASRSPGRIPIPIRCFASTRQRRFDLPP